MGTGKKESARRAREAKPNDIKGNLHTKGENFYRSAKRVKTLNTFKDQGPTRNARGDVTQAASYQSTSTPKARVEPHRKWFTNTRVIGQDALSKFRDAVEERAKDPYSYLLKRNKLPMSLINDGKDKERKDGVVQHQAKMRIEGEKFADTFGPKAQRKRVRLEVGSLEDMASAIQQSQDNHAEKQTEEEDANQLHKSNGMEGQEEEGATAREPVFSKGQSKRIWNELYKVIDSSDVVIHVLDARDPLGTRCRSVEKYIREEAPHKHLLFLLNKCDLVPTGVAAKWVRLLSKEYPTLAFHASLTNSFGKGTLISLLRQFSTLHSSRKQVSVGFIGYPNTGKSSIINTLRKKKVCKTAPIPGETKVWQYITLMKRIYLIDCPGIVPPSMSDAPEEVLLRGSVRVENVENPAQYVPAVLARCKARHLERTYGVSGWSGASGSSAGEVDNTVGTPATDQQRTLEAVQFLEALAKKGGRLLKGGEADLDGVAKMVLNDFLRGRIPWFVPPPVTEADGEGGDEKGEGRDEMLGFTHGKRKRALMEDEDNEDATIGADGGPVLDDFEGFEDNADEDDSQDDNDSDEDVDGKEDSDDNAQDEDEGGVDLKTSSLNGVR